MRKLRNEELDRISIDEFKNKKKIPLVIVLDNVRSLNNVGSAFRTSDAFCIDKIYLCGITGKPPHREINKTALGATDSVTWEHVESTLTLIKQLKEDGYTIVSIEQADESIMLNDYQPNLKEKYCFVFGNEVFGVDDEVINISDMCLEIPQFGTKHSLNISVSVGIVVWDHYCKTVFSY
ncbi:RNA methyltransferase [Fulvivirgaceae bacterium BMA10]|uniref:RNA methyltransferase n=1 Tax=Splendidivirga corallicola TaxID=3051826 RepID=A0ABT8KUQ4_9BACT|nr:RNA methyltransferase [Fulvivirgaceae bacterium BMA10]